MFTLSIQFATIDALTAFVKKVGGPIDGKISHETPISTQPPMQAAPVLVTVPAPNYVHPTQAPAEAPLTPAQKAAATKAAKKAAEAAQAPVSAPLPFPGQHTPPTNFAPGPATMAAAPQPVNQPYVAPVQQPAPVAPAPVAVSPERKQYNDACVALVNQLGATGIPEAQLAQTLSNTFTEAGCGMGSRISTISDAQIQVFYPILHRNVSQVIASAQQPVQQY